jgi:hypothetical protein
VAVLVAGTVPVIVMFWVAPNVLVRKLELVVVPSAVNVPVP